MMSDTDFKNIDEYREYAKTLSPSDLQDVLRNINRERYPERYDIVAKLAQEKSGSVAVELAYPKGVIVVRNIYIALLALLVFSVVMVLFVDTSQSGTRGILMLILNMLVFGSIVAGIYHIKPWVVTLVLLFSYLTLARLFLETLANTPEPPPGHPFSTLLFAVFCSYQIVIFSRPSTKKFFRHRGTDII